MSLKKVLEAWIEYGLEPNRTSDLSDDDQRELLADVLTEEPDMLGEAFAEVFASSPAYRTAFLSAYRTRNQERLFKVCDDILKERHIGSDWLEFELEEARQIISLWDEDR